MNTPVPNPRPADDHRPAPWWALNGYVLLVAGLAIFIVGIPGIAAGPAGTIEWVYRAGSVAAGVGLCWGLFAADVRIEAAAGGLLAVANLADAANELATAVPPAVSWHTILLQAIIIAGVSLRIWALSRGGVSVIPPWSRR